MTSALVLRLDQQDPAKALYANSTPALGGSSKQSRTTLNPMISVPTFTRLTGIALVILASTSCATKPTGLPTPLPDREQRMENGYILYLDGAGGGTAKKNSVRGRQGGDPGSRIHWRWRDVFLGDGGWSHGRSESQRRIQTIEGTGCRQAHREVCRRLSGEADGGLRILCGDGGWDLRPRGSSTGNEE